MKETIKAIIKKIIAFLPIAKIIIFESIPDLSDNTKAVFDEFIRRGINNEYKCIWIVGNPKADYPKLKNVIYVKSYSRRLKWYRLFAKCFICCNDWVTTLRKGQTSFYLSHGTTIKRLKGYYNVPENIDYCLSAAEGVEFLCENEFMVKKEKIFSLGFPRNDILTKANRDLKPLFDDSEFEKVIVWYPTYRQHKNGLSVTTGNSLPIIHNEKKAEQLNKTAKENKVLIVLKPHFAQDISYVKNMKLSNIKFIDDMFFTKNNISSYEFVGSCEALITDYSSIYYDYTLCDKPIALIWEDYEEYKSSTGFADGCEDFLKGGQKVYTLEELEEFVKDVALGNDKFNLERNEVCRQVNYSIDGKNSKRVVDFIIDKAKL